MNRVKYLAIDPGFGRCGWAIVSRASASGKILVEDLGCWETSAKLSLIERIQSIYTQADSLIKKYHPHTLVLEKIFSNNNKSTAGGISEVRGAFFALSFLHQLKLREFTPNQIKLAVTGHGSADKTAVKKMVELQAQLTPPHTWKTQIDDTIDAVAVGMTAFFVPELRETT